MTNEALLYRGTPVSRICHTEIVRCSPDDSLDHALKLMAERNIGSVLVCKNDYPLGIVTRAEAMVTCVTSPFPQAPVSVQDVMSKRLLIVAPEESLDDVGVELMNRNLRHAVVMSSAGRLIGIVSERDIVNSQGMEHDLFLKSVSEIAPSLSLRLGIDVSIRDAIDAVRNSRQSAALVNNGPQHFILTETDIIRILADRTELHRPLREIELSEVVAIPDSLSLYSARKVFLQHGFRHLGVSDSSGEISRILSYTDILRSVERDYVIRLRELLDNSSEALQQSRHSLKLIEKVINASMEGVLVTDAQGLIESINPAFTEITGYEAHEVIGKNPNLLSSGRHDSGFYERMWDSLSAAGQWQGEIWNRSKDGTVYPEWLNITAITNGDGEVTQYAAIFHDLTELKRSEARIRQMAHFDEVTRLANRKLFADRLQMAIHYAREEGRRFAVLAIDLDMFKRINDRFGHECGDEVLRTIASRIDEQLSAADTAARPSGDEFQLILNDIADHGIHEQLEHLLRVISMPLLINANEVRITASVGVAIYPEDGRDMDGLLSAAEAALHQTKEQGRNSFSFFSPEQHQQRQSRYLITTHLHQALDKGEFELFFQPKVCLNTGRVAGVEALLRWFCAELGTVPPDQFIPLAEDTGLIDAIGDWVLDEAASQAKSWSLQGVELPVAVNLSARQFMHNSVADKVGSVLNKYQLAPGLLSVELTETSFLHSAEQTAEALLSLRELGVGVSIDDFGTGYSSLSYIRTMSLDELKVDRSFINNITESERDRQLVSAIIAMSQALGLGVVAEGVETLDQLKMLRALGCDQAQGYLLCRPQSAEKLLRWYDDYKRNPIRIDLE